MTIFGREDSLRVKIILRFIVLLVLLIPILHGNGDAADKRADTTALPILLKQKRAHWRRLLMN